MFAISIWQVYEGDMLHIAEAHTHKRRIVSIEKFVQARNASQFFGHFGGFLFNDFSFLAHDWHQFLFVFVRFCARNKTSHAHNLASSFEIIPDPEAGLRFAVQVKWPATSLTVVGSRSSIVAGRSARLGHVCQPKFL